MNAQAAPELPTGVVALDEFFRCASHVAVERNPVEVRNDQNAPLA